MIKSYLSSRQPRRTWDAGEIYDNAKRAYHETGKRLVLIDIDTLPGWADREYVKQIGEAIYGKLDA